MGTNPPSTTSHFSGELKESFLERTPFSGPEFLSHGVVCFVSTVSFWDHQIESLSLADGRVLTKQKVVSELTHGTKLTTSRARAQKNYTRRWCLFLGTILFEVANSFGNVYGFHSLLKYFYNAFNSRLNHVLDTTLCCYQTSFRFDSGVITVLLCFSNTFSRH